MEREALRQRLEHILGKRISISNDRAETERDSNETVIETSGDIEYIIHGALTKVEEQLVALVLDSISEKEASDLYPTEEERQSALLSAWIQERLEKGDVDAELPESYAAWPSLSGHKIPMMLYGEFPDKQQAPYGDLRKLLHSFFEDEVAIIPIHNKMWFILGDAALIGDSRSEEETEASLGEFASGLQEMVASEWMGECHVAITYPFMPANSLVSKVALLQEMIDLGITYRFSSNIHMPWELRLESLLDKVPASSKRRFVDEVFQGAEASLDAELIATLETFLQENCNVSDTAKKLYIHRNTLLYRLDKFKQETGLDVRGFDHAVLVKLALLLYKVTKRK